MKIFGNVLLTMTILFAISCKKDSSTANNTNSPYYFTATINGSAVKYEADDLNSRLSCGFTDNESSLWPDDFDIYQGTLIENDQEPSKNSIQVQILKYFNHEPTVDEKIAMIKVGNYSYGYSHVSSSTVNGADIEYIDGNGVSWMSQMGSQTGSTFAITELVNNPNHTSGKIFTATFSCELYDGNGGSIQVTNGKIRGKLFNP